MSLYTSGVGFHSYIADRECDDCGHTVRVDVLFDSSHPEADEAWTCECGVEHTERSPFIDSEW